jgi:hypothetical protein
MKKDFIIRYKDLSYLKEDMFQWEYGNILLDVGYYDWGLLKAQVVKDYDWDQPLECITFHNVSFIEPIIAILKDRIVTWYFSWNFIKNKWYNKEE